MLHEQYDCHFIADLVLEDQCICIYCGNYCPRLFVFYRKYSWRGPHCKNFIKKGTTKQLNNCSHLLDASFIMRLVQDGIVHGAKFVGGKMVWNGT